MQGAAAQHQGAPPDETVPAPPDPETLRLERKARAVRRRVLLTLSPLVATFFVPWPNGFSWEVADQLNSSAVLAIPFVGLAATIVALAKKRSLLVRSLVLGALGVGLGGLFFDALTSPALIRELPSDVRRWDAYALYLVLGIPLLTITLELLAALDRRSRPRAILAGFGWLALVTGYLLPFRSDRLEEMPLLFMADALTDADRHPEKLLVIGPMVLLLFLGLGAAALTILRLIGDPERRERWRPRSGCLAIGLVVPPAVLVLLGFVVAAVFDEVEFLGVAYNGAVYLLGFALGVPVALASGLDGLAGVGRLAAGRGEVQSVRRARYAVGAVVLGGALWCLAPVVGAFLPDRREARGADALVEVAEVIVAAAAGEAVDPRFVGGYSEFDLRASVGLLRDPAAEPALEYATFEIVVVGHSNAVIEVGVSPDGELRYLRGGPAPYPLPPESSLGRASEPLGGLAARIGEGLSSLACLPTSPPPDLPGLVDATDSIAPLCDGGGSPSRRRVRDIGGSRDGWGGTGRYRLWVRSGAVTHRLEGTLFSDGGRLWIGRAALVPGEGD